MILRFQAFLLFSTLAFAWNGFAQEAPVRYGDPEVIWESESPSPAPTKTPEPKNVIAAPPVRNDVSKSPSDRLKAILATVKPGEDYPAQFSEIIQIGPDVVGPLSKIFLDSSQNWQTRWIAAMALGKLGGEEAFSSLQTGLNDTLFLVRMASVTALGNSENAESLTLVRKSLSDKAMVVRAAVTDALAKMKDRESVSLLGDELWASRNFHRGRSLWIREHIVDALAQIGDEKAVPSLIRILKENDFELRVKACDALDHIVKEAPPQPKGTTTCVEKWIAWSQRPR